MLPIKQALFGYFHGEGSMNIYLSRTREGRIQFSPKVTCKSKDGVILSTFVNIWGGKLSPVKNRTDMWTWTCPHKIMKQFLKELAEGILESKKNVQARLMLSALELLENRGEKILNHDLIQELGRISFEISSHNNVKRVWNKEILKDWTQPTKINPLFWTKEETQQLKELYPTKTAKDLADIFDRSLGAIYQKIHREGFIKNEVLAQTMRQRFQ